MGIINRIIEKNIENRLFQEKAIIIYGARQVGKTTLIQQIERRLSPTHSSLMLNCDEPDVRQALTNKTSTELAALIGDARLVFIDEAQRVENIGITIKLIVDNIPHVQIIATGSSSFELSNRIAEPLTGRIFTFYLGGLSVEELLTIQTPLEIQRLLESRLLLGMYPDIVTARTNTEERLFDIAQSTLFKDVLQFQHLRKPEVLEKLLQALALQIGQEVSYNELATTIGVHRKTIQHYIHLLEQAFIIFRLRPFTRNARKGITKLRKIYFYDTGIRNAVLMNFHPLALRQDVGALWENFLISERMKLHANHGRRIRTYFWRTPTRQKVDFVEDEVGAIHGFEMKWDEKKAKMPHAWQEAYPDASWECVDRDHWIPFLTK